MTDADVKPFVDLVKAKLAEKHSFEQAVRVGLTAVMVSPDFLFLREKPGQARRLRPGQPAVVLPLEHDARRGAAHPRRAGEAASSPRRSAGRSSACSKHPKAAAFTENFVGQWLGLRDIDSTEPSHILYPEFDHMLKVSMIRETELFFDEVLKDDLSLTNFVASDFTMLNGRLAKHYGIPGVDGLGVPQGDAAAGTATAAAC